MFKPNKKTLNFDAKKDKNLIIVHDLVLQAINEINSLEFITSSLTISNTIKANGGTTSPSTCGRALRKLVNLGVLERVDAVGNTGTLYRYITEED